MHNRISNDVPPSFLFNYKRKQIKLQIVENNGISSFTGMIKKDIIRSTNKR